ncbi:MAG: NAD(P)/FAD-dependent oxidoreductase, partial [Thermacetogeniaceae bacterium]
HAKKLGAVIEVDRIESIYPGDEITLVTRGYQMLKARSVILATGVQQSKFLPGEKEFLGRGVGYCATCDAPLYRGKVVAVIGEIAEAEEEVNFLADVCEKVHYFPAYRDVGRLDPRVEVHSEKPIGIVGDGQVRGLAFAGGELPVAGVFIIRDVAPPERLVEGLEIREGAIVVNREMETNVPGIFAAGDCTGKPYQVGKAIGEGLTAALSAVSYLDKREKQLS